MRKLWVVLAKYFALAFLVGLTWNGLKSNPPIAAMACGIIVAIFISYAIGMFQHKPEEPPKEQQRKQNNAAQQEIYDRHMQVIGESLDLVKTSKSIDTRISRMDVAISTLESLIAHFDDIQELKEWHAALVDFHRPALHREKLEDAVEKHMIRARAVTTLKAKISNAEKALIEVESAYSDPYIDKKAVDHYKQAINQFLTDVQVNDYAEKARKHEFKGHYDKAADAYLDALFHIKNDAVPDELQAEQILEIERMANDLRKRANQQN